MSVPYYVSPEQIIADKAEFARKGIARGRSVIVASAADAIYFIADNPSRALHKIGEIYDKIGFAAVRLNLISSRASSVPSTSSSTSCVFSFSSDIGGNYSIGLLRQMLDNINVRL